jgi:hypothetical protein
MPEQTITAYTSVSSSVVTTLSGSALPPPDVYVLSGGTLNLTGGVTLSGAVYAQGAGPVGIALAAGGELDNSGKVENTANQIYYFTRAGVYDPPYAFYPAGTFPADQGAAAVLARGGVVNNLAGGLIAGTGGGISLTGAATILNAGSIAGLASKPFSLHETIGSTVSPVTITAWTGNGIELNSAAGADIVNSGTITGWQGIGPGPASNVTTGPMTIANTSGGVISGQVGGVWLDVGVAAVTNSGLITGATGLVAEAGVIVNNAGGVISGGTFGQGVYQAGILGTSLFTLENAGTISGYWGASLDWGTLVNTGLTEGSLTGVLLRGAVADNTGTITGHYGVYETNGFFKYSTFSNAGLVQGGTAGVWMGNYNTLTNAAGGTITGTAGVQAGEWVTITNAGTIGGSAEAIAMRAYMSRLTVDPGAAFIGAVTATLDSATPQFGATLEFAAGTAALNLGGSFSGFTALQFDTGAAWSVTGTTAELAAGESITGFGLGDTLVLQGVAAHSGSVVSGTGLVLSTGTTLDISGTAAGYSVNTNGTNTTITAVPCFCAGTRLRTPGGEVAVEDLRPGDLVETAHAGPQPVRWIGHRAYEGRFIAGRHLMLPVTIKAGALAADVPSRDLHVSPGHALWVDGLLIPAWRLVNDESITQAEVVERVDYFHVELPGHEVVFAEGCPTESFYDDACRSQFQSAAGAPAACAAPLPRCESGFALEAVRARLASRTAIAPALGALHGYVDVLGPDEVSGWAQDLAAPETPVALDILVDGVRAARVLANAYRADLREAALGSGCHGFAVALPVRGRVEVRRAADSAVLGPTTAARAAA